MKLSIGIDWGDKSHAVCIREKNTRRMLTAFTISHDVPGITRLEESVEALGCMPDDCVVAVETNQGLLVNYLMGMGYHIYPIPPAAVKPYRDRRRRTGAKSDPDDAQILSDILCLDHALYSPLANDSPLAREIRAVYRGREQLIRRRTQVLNQLNNNLKTYFPVAIGLFSGLQTQIARAFLETFPTQQEAQAASETELVTFFEAQGYTRTDKIPEKLARLRASAILVPDWQAKAGAFLTRALMSELDVLCEQIFSFEKRLAQLLALHPDAALFLSLPRVGLVLAAGLIAELGDCREKFQFASDLQALAGTAPVTRQSGSRKHVLFRFACNKPLRHLLHEFARQSAMPGGSIWARGYLANQLERGHSASRAYRALANRWLVIIFRLWNDRTLYDEHYHLLNIAQRGVKSPALPLAQVA